MENYHGKVIIKFHLYLTLKLKIKNYLEKNVMNENGIDLIEMKKDDIVRHQVVTKIIELYE